MLPRHLKDLVAALRRHVELLRVYAHHAFQERNELFLGEVAAKLRMLVAEHGRSRPLLLDLMDELGADVRFKLDLPPVQDPDYDKEITLRHYMGRKGLGIATASGLRMLSHSEFVREWANQYGTARGVESDGTLPQRTPCGRVHRRGTCQCRNASTHH